VIVASERLAFVIGLEFLVDGSLRRSLAIENLVARGFIAETRNRIGSGRLGPTLGIKGSWDSVGEW
jgi:hypothetical protein